MPTTPHDEGEESSDSTRQSKMKVSMGRLGTPYGSVIDLKMLRVRFD